MGMNMDPAHASASLTGTGQGLDRRAWDVRAWYESGAQLETVTCIVPPSLSRIAITDCGHSQTSKCMQHLAS